jgi:hypothetical protein
MRRVLRPYFKRGRLTDRVTWALFVGLLTVLIVSLVHGVGSLPLS